MLDVRRWALAQGRPVDPDILGLVIAGKLSWGDEPLDRWMRIDVYGHLYSRVPNWCTMQRVMVPIDVPEVLWMYLWYLDEAVCSTPPATPSASSANRCAATAASVPTG